MKNQALATVIGAIIGAWWYLLVVWFILWDLPNMGLWDPIDRLTWLLFFHAALGFGGLFGYGIYKQVTDSW